MKEIDLQGLKRPILTSINACDNSYQSESVFSQEQFQDQKEERRDHDLTSFNKQCENADGYFSEPNQPQFLHSNKSNEDNKDDLKKNVAQQQNQLQNKSNGYNTSNMMLKNQEQYKEKRDDEILGEQQNLDSQQPKRDLNKNQMQTNRDQQYPNSDSYQLNRDQKSPKRDLNRDQKSPKRDLNRDQKSPNRDSNRDQKSPKRYLNRDYQQETRFSYQSDRDSKRNSNESNRDQKQSLQMDQEMNFNRLKSGIFDDYDDDDDDDNKNLTRDDTLETERGTTEMVNDQKYFKEDTKDYDEKYQKMNVSGYEMRDLSNSYAVWSWAQFFEFFFYHLIYIFLGPASIIVFYPFNGIFLYKNLGFNINGDFSWGQFIIWLLNGIMTFMYYWFDNSNMKTHFFEIYDVWIMILFRLFSISCKYAMFHPLLISIYKQKILTGEQKSKDFYLKGWYNQTKECKLEELFCAQKRCEVELALFNLHFFWKVSPITNQVLLEIQEEQVKYKQCKHEEDARRNNSRSKINLFRKDLNPIWRQSNQVDFEKKNEKSYSGYLNYDIYKMTAGQSTFSKDDIYRSTRNITWNVSENHFSSPRQRQKSIEYNPNVNWQKEHSNDSPYQIPLYLQYNGMVILQYLINQFNQRYTIYHSNKIIFFIAIIRSAIALVFHLTYDPKSFLTFEWTDCVMFALISLMNFSLSLVMGYFMMTLLADLHRIYYLMIQMLFLIKPRKDENFLAYKKVFPTLNLIYGMNFRNWVQLRGMCYEYGMRFWLRGQANLSFMVAYSLYPLICLILHLFDVFNMCSLQLWYLIYDILIVTLSVSLCLYFSASINYSYVYHVHILEEIRIIFRNLLRDDDLLKNPLSSYLYRMILRMLRKQTNDDIQQINISIAKVIESIDDSKSELILLQSSRPFQCFGFVITFDMLKSLLLFISSLLTLSLNFYLKQKFNN